MVRGDHFWELSCPGKHETNVNLHILFSPLEILFPSKIWQAHWLRTLFFSPVNSCESRDWQRVGWTEKLRGRVGKRTQEPESCIYCGEWVSLQPVTAHCPACWLWAELPFAWWLEATWPVLKGETWNLLNIQILQRLQSSKGVVKNPLANTGNMREVGSIPGSGRTPWRRA